MRLQEAYVQSVGDDTPVIPRRIRLLGFPVLVLGRPSLFQRGAISWHASKPGASTHHADDRDHGCTPWRRAALVRPHQRVPTHTETALWHPRNSMGGAIEVQALMP